MVEHGVPRYRVPGPARAPGPRGGPRGNMHRLLSTSAAMVLLPALIALGALLVVRRVVWVEQDALRRYATVSERALEAERLNAESEHLGRMVRAYLLAPNPELEREFDVSRERFERTLERLRAMSQEPRERELLEAGARSEQHIHAISRELMRERTRGLPWEEFLPRVDTQLDPARAELDGALARLVRYQREELRAASDQARQVTGGVVRLYLVAFLLAVGLLVAQAVMVMRELRRRRRAQEAAERSAARHAAAEARFAGMVSIAADAIISVDEAQRISLFNAGAESIFGYGAAEVLGQPLDMLLPERFRARHRALLQAFAEGPATSRRMGDRRVVFGLRKNGEEFPAEATISKLGEGPERLYIVSLRDVTERHRVEREQRFLAAAGAMLAESIDYELTLRRVARLTVPDLADLCIVYLRTPSGQVEPAAIEHVEPHMASFAREILRRYSVRTDISVGAGHVIATGQNELVREVSTERLRALARDEQHYRMLVQLGVRSYISVPLRARGEVLGAITLMRVEASRRRQSPEDLVLAQELARRAALALDNARLYRTAQEATHARDEMLDVVAHDLRNPLQSILVMGSALGRRLQAGTSPESMQKLVAGIETSVRRMSRLVEDLLAVKRLDRGRMSVQPSLERPEALVHEALGAARPLAERHELRGEVGTGLPPVLADKDRVLQVFSNLLGNAFKFTPPGGTVEVGAALAGPHVCFWVRDTGQGIPAEQQPHVFERFWQGSQHDARGMGLGLAICKGLVEAHGGRIWLESTPGEGSTFRFTLPVAEASPEEMSA